MTKRLFGSTGIRGRVFGPIIAESNEQFTPATIIRLGMVWTHFKTVPSIMLSGRDPRYSSEMVQSAANAGILAMGSDIIVHQGILPTPAMNYACKMRNSPGVMITGSHTPPEMNALKFLLENGAEIDAQTGEVEIEDLYFDSSFTGQNDPLACGSTETDNLLTHYLQYLDQNLTQDLSGLTIVLDPGNGCMGNGLINHILSRHGASVIAINEILDGHFPGRGPEPLLPESLERVSQLVLRTGADLGVAFDSDGDRSIFVDDKGRMVWGDYTLALIAQNFLKPSDTIATPVSTAGIIEDVAEIQGFKVLWTAVGAAEVTRVCLEQQLPLGGEQNGGIIFPQDNPARDGGRTTIELLKLIKDEKKSLSSLVDALPQYYITKEKVPHSEKLLVHRSAIMDAIIQHFSEYESINLDGLKLYLDKSTNTSCLMRFSMTEPIFRIFTNSQDQQIMLKHHQYCVSIVKKIIKDIESKV